MHIFPHIRPFFLSTLQAFLPSVLPGAVSGMNDILLSVIRDAKLSKHRLKELTPQNKGPHAPPPCLSTEDGDWVAGATGPLVVAAAVYALYSIYHAQPKETLTRIRVPRDYHQSVLGAFKIFFLFCRSLSFYFYL
jgi:hypothetical protein